MAESLSPFVYWGQTNDIISLKIALRNTEVSERTRLNAKYPFWILALYSLIRTIEMKVCRLPEKSRLLLLWEPLLFVTHNPCTQAFEFQKLGQKSWQQKRAVIHIVKGPPVVVLTLFKRKIRNVLEYSGLAVLIPINSKILKRISTGWRTVFKLTIIEYWLFRISFRV